MNAQETQTGAGISAAHEITIEWSYGFSETFNGTRDEAYRKVLSDGLHEDYLDGSNVDTRTYQGYTEVMEYRLGVDGMSWHFVARIYGA
jgi:hypothetical protein